MNSSKSFSTLHYPFPRRVCSVLVVAIGSWLEVCVIDFFFAGGKLFLPSHAERRLPGAGTVAPGLWPVCQSQGNESTRTVRHAVPYTTLSKAAKHYTTLTSRQHYPLHNLPPHSRIHNIRHHMLRNTCCSRPRYAARAVSIVLTRISSTLNNLTICSVVVILKVSLTHSPAFPKG